MMGKLDGREIYSNFHCRDVIKCDVIGDGTWIFKYKPETKNSQWKSFTSLRSKVKMFIGFIHFVSPAFSSIISMDHLFN
jgi:hypothetical protein